VSKLKQAWVYHFGAGQANQGDEGIDYRFEVTPLIIGDVMYMTTPAPPRAPNNKATVTALKPETGQVLWKFESPYNIHGRGLAYWPGDATTAPRVIFGTAQGLIMAVDVTTGQLAQGFGRNGVLDAYVGVSSEIVGESRRNSFTIPNPVTIYKNLIIAGSRPEESGPPAPRGDIRAFDVKTGRLTWAFHTVPQPGEPGHETYKADDWRDTSGANVWSTMALDEANGIVYAPTGDLNSDVGGSHLYASSLLALDAATGKLKWYKQIVHHDMWDWDAPTPPVLFDYKGKDGKTIPAVLQTGKQGLVFLFNRLTGESINGFTETPIDRPGPGQVGEVWPTQPLPKWPGNVARVQMKREEIPNFAPGMREACTKFWDDNKIVSVPLYAPRQTTSFATISYPSSTGGPNWGGGAYNPDTGMYYINVQNRATFRPKAAPGDGVGGMNRTPRPAPAGPPAPRLATAPRQAQPFTFTTKDGLNLTCSATPWGELVAVDLRNEKIAWRVPLGTTPALGAAGANTGSPNLGGSITTKSGLVFIGAANDRLFRAFDGKTGKILWKAPLEASAHSTPITFMGANGKQYVVVVAAGGTSAGGREMSDTVVAYTLP
jgi:quinoprotein glucose dehydrogenase